MNHGRSAVIAAAVAAVAAGSVFIAAWALWPRPGTVAAPRARQYLDASACLLTGSTGVSPGTPGGHAWQAMESASKASHVMVSYLPGTGPADVPALLNTLVERKCGVIVVTAASRDQVASAARANPGRRFILVTSSTQAGPAAVPSNTDVVPATDASRRINQEVIAIAGAA